MEKLKVDFIDAMTDTLEGIFAIYLFSSVHGITGTTINKSNPWVLSLTVAEKPLVAAIDGLAFGAGLEFFMVQRTHMIYSSFHHFLTHFVLSKFLIVLIVFSQLGMPSTHFNTNGSIMLSKASAWSNTWFWR